MTGKSLPNVMVGITTQNRAHILPKAIQSALSQDYPNIQVVVMDDASTDDTPGLRGRFPTVQWLRNDSALGIIEGRNRLMRLCEDGFYLSLDDDAWFMRHDEISLAVERLMENPKVAAIAYDILSPDRTMEQERSAPKSVSMFIGCGHILRVSSVREAGYYASTPGNYGSEEKDLALRLYDLDLRIELMPGVHVWHDKAWTGRDWTKLHSSGVCNDLTLTGQRYPFPEVLGVIPYKFIRHIMFAVRRRGLLQPTLHGFAVFFRRLPETCMLRKPVRRETLRRIKQECTPQRQ
jgi:GT2 family glycosyltransferase